MGISNFLDTIIAGTRQRIARVREQHPEEVIRDQAVEARRDATRYTLRATLRNDIGIRVIAEFKRASPSKGSIRTNASPDQIARAYEKGGAAAISVLTEEAHFLGSLDDLRSVRAVVKRPVLRKDFIIDDYQVYESAGAGADALLLIVAALTDEDLLRLRRLTEEELGMDALVEVHTAEELRRATDCGATLIGVNNRDLRTFDVSLDVSFKLATLAPKHTLLVSESGLRNRADIQILQSHGYTGFLVGEMLMRADDPEEALRQMIRGTKK